MKTKITIKSIFGKILSEYEKNGNNVKETLIKAVSNGADLRGAYLTGADLTGADLTGAYLRDADLTGADLTGADLTGADLRGADLTGADLTGAYLRGAYLRDADLTGAYLRGADLTGAYLRGAYLRGADLRGAYDKKIEIEKATVLTGLYKYIVVAFIDKKGNKWVQMGCYTRKLKEWEKDFWNNPNEFLNHETEDSKLRLFAFETAKKWFETITI